MTERHVRGVCCRTRIGDKGKEGEEEDGEGRKSRSSSTEQKTTQQHIAAGLTEESTRREQNTIIVMSELCAWNCLIGKAAAAAAAPSSPLLQYQVFFDRLEVTRENLVTMPPLFVLNIRRREA